MQFTRQINFLFMEYNFYKEKTVKRGLGEDCKTCSPEVKKRWSL